MQKRDNVELLKQDALGHGKNKTPSAVVVALITLTADIGSLAFFLRKD